jgi:hypothetical protein
MSAQRAATAAQKIATRGEMSGIRLVHRAPELGRQRGNLDRSPFAEGDHSGVDIIAKRAVEYVPPNENSDTRLPAITAGSGLVGRRDWGPMPLGPGFATGDGRVCPMTLGRFKAHFGSRISARRRALPPAPATALPRDAHHNRTSETQPSNGIRSLASAHDR